MRQLEYANGASDFMRELKQSIVAEFVKYINGYNGCYVVCYSVIGNVHKLG